MSRKLYKNRDKKRINKCGKHLYGWKNSIPLGFYTQKSLLKIDFYINLFSVFRPFGRLDISYQLNFIYKEDTFNEDKESTNTGSYEKVRQNGCKKEYGKEWCHTDQQD